MDIIPITGFSDPVSSMTHLFSLPFILAFSFVLIREFRGDLSRTVSLSIFVFAAVFLLTMSGLFHLLEPDSSARYVFQMLDHAAIFLLIAATFTPIHILQFKGFMRWGILSLVWGTAITSITLKSIYFDEVPESLSLTLYLGIGWLGAITGYKLYRRLGINAIAPLLNGALAYSLGAIMEFLHFPILWPGVIGPHELFHVLVLLGIATHWQFVRRMALLHKQSTHH